MLSPRKWCLSNPVPRKNTHSTSSVLFDLRGAIIVGTRCGDLTSVVLVGVRSLFYISVADRIQVATCPSTRSAFLMFIHPVLRLVPETSQLLTLVHFVCLFLFRLPMQFDLIRGFRIAPSMFGRDLIEQVRADTRGEERYVPVIVEKCIDAVDALGELVVFQYIS